MKFKGQTPNEARPARPGFFMLSIVSISALGAAFAVSALEIGLVAKTLIFAGVTGAYLLFCFLFYFRKPARAALISNSESESPVSKKFPAEEVFSAETREKLLALEEASLIFGSALKPADMFRLVANRVAEIVPFQTITLFLANRGVLRAAQAFGTNASDFTENPEESARGVARKAFENRDTTLDEQLNLDRLYLSASALHNLKSVVAVPLRRDGEIYGVLALYGARENFFDNKAVRLFEAVAERVSPLFLSSMAFEANLNSALTDAVTGLPNERALFLILENQIAEAQRNREGRALTVLSVDIKDFDRLNKSYGHQTGDRILSFAAGKIKAQLRQMDFLSRAVSDEFLVILPTASEEIAETIVERIEKSFAAETFDENGVSIIVELNFGAASFITDAETASELLRIARRRRSEAKSPSGGSILQFPERFPH